MTPTGSSDAATDRTPADLVAAAVRTVPGVAGLHPGPLGQIGTLLPGRRVDGVRVRPDVTEVHVTAVVGTPLNALADALIAAVGPVTGTRVDVVVEDVAAARPTPGTTTSQEIPS